MASNLLAMASNLVAMIRHPRHHLLPPLTVLRLENSLRVSCRCGVVEIFLPEQKCRKKNVGRPDKKIYIHED